MNSKFLLATTLILAFLSVTNSQCTDTNCGTCPADPGTCTACKDATFYLDTTCKACSTLTGCSQCSSSSVCTQCVDNTYALDTNTNSCTSCSTITGCSKCSSTTACTTCAQGYYIQTNNCVACSTIDANCDTWSDSTTCSKCKAGYFLEGTTSCKACSDGCTTCTSATECTVCSKKYYLSGKACVNCNTLSNCSECSSKDVCTTCLTSDFFLIDGACSPCDVGFWFDTDGEGCKACQEGCNKCTEDTCLKCKDALYLVTPANQTCNSCDVQGTNLLIKVSDQLSICTFYPTIDSTVSPTVTTINGMTGAVVNNICKDSSFSTASSMLSVAYVCGTSADSISKFSIVDTKSKVPQNSVYSAPNYTDSEGKFWGFTQNNTIYCPSLPGSKYSLNYSCINSQGLSITGTLAYTTPDPGFSGTILEVKLNSAPSTAQISSILCAIENNLGLSGKGLVLSEDGTSCQKTSSRRYLQEVKPRFLQTAEDSKYDLVILIAPDPYQAAFNVTSVVLQRVTDGTLKSDISKNVASASISSIAGSSVDLKATVVVPNFTLDKSVVATLNQTSIALSLTVDNTDSIVWIGMVANSKSVTAPTKLQELKAKTDLDALGSVIIPKGASKLVSFSSLTQSTGYTFYLAAESLVGDSSTSLLVAKYNTLSSNSFIGIVLNSFVALLMLIALLF